METILDEDFRRVRQLGRGSFAQCQLLKYVGNASLPPLVCRKELLQDRGSRSVDVENFRRELALLRRLNHPNIVRCFGGAGSDRPFMLLEYVEGGSLRKLMLLQMSSPGRRFYTDASALRWCTQLASALAYLHGHQPPILHRDVHPENIILTSVHSDNADICLIDFGLHRRLPTAGGDLHEGFVNGEASPGAARTDTGPALAIAAERTHDEADTICDTQLSAFTGTGNFTSTDPACIMTGQTGAYMYMSPEMVRSQPYSTASDVFSMGMVMYEVFGGFIRSACLPHGSAHALEDMATRVAGGYRPAIPSKVPPAIAVLIRQCWAQDPADRPSAASVVKQLESISLPQRSVARLSTSATLRQPFTPLGLTRLLSRRSG